MAKYAQHFLINQHAIERIIQELHLSPDDTVLEIGPGRGALTTYLVRRAKQVIAIEVDQAMITALKNKLGAAKNFHLIHQDILNADFPLSPPLVGGGRGRGEPYKVVGNLPYNLTSPILRKLSEWDGWSFALLMVQKEVGDRLCAAVGSSDYGALTVGVNLTSKIEPVFVLSESSFKPAPKIKSMVVKLTRRPVPLSPRIDVTQRVIQAAFQQRRKTILNSLSHGLDVPKETVKTWLKNVGLPESERAEQITVVQFVKLSACL